MNSENKSVPIFVQSRRLTTIVMKRIMVRNNL